MTENFLNLERGKAMQAQEAQRVPIKTIPKRPTPRHIIIKMPSFKDKENLKNSKGETRNNIQGNSDEASSKFLNRNTTSQKGMARNIQSNEKKRPATKMRKRARYIKERIRRWASSK